MRIFRYQVCSRESKTAAALLGRDGGMASFRLQMGAAFQSCGGLVRPESICLSPQLLWARPICALSKSQHPFDIQKKALSIHSL